MEYKTSILAIFIAFISLGTLQGQATSDTVSIQANYTQQSYYSLSNGLVGSHSLDSWDIGFDASAFGSSIRVNGALGCELYEYANGDTGSWANIDTNGLGTWPPLYDSDTSWALGGFNRNTDNNFDLGWGTYNVVTHAVSGDRIFLLKLASGDWKKIWIKSLAGGVFSFLHANLDGSSEQMESVAKSDYSDRNFVYFSFSQGSPIDLEPSSASWDFVFSRYIAEISPGFYYGVTGALQHPAVQVAEVIAADPQNASWTGQNYEGKINTIGYDWKSFDFSTGWLIEDSLVYFVRDQEQGIWRLVFTDFGGSADGNFIFTKEQVSVANSSIQEAKPLLRAFPNPAPSGQFDILFEQNRPLKDARLEIWDLSGQLVYQQDLGSLSTQLYQIPIRLDHPAAGIYLLQIRGEGSSIHQRLVISN